MLFCTGVKLCPPQNVQTYFEVENRFQ